jgi:hypothetical protein
MALNFYGRMLLDNPDRKSEGVDYIKQSEAIVQNMPFWYNKLESIHLTEFDLN